jgi:anti-sigma factor RsiW
MSENLDHIAALQITGRCIRPEVGELLADYIVGLLADAKAEELEEHLLFCPRCREDYLKIIRIRSAARAAKTGNGTKEKYATAEGADILRMSDYKK